MSHLHHKVSALVDGELSGAARRRAIEHTQTCAACRRELEATLALKRRLLGLSAAEPSADLFATLASVTPGAEDTTHTGSPSTLTTRRLLAGLSSVSLALLGLAYAVGAPSTAAASPVRPPIEEFTAEFAGVSGGTPLGDPAVEALTAAGYLASALQPAALRGLSAGPRADLRSWAALAGSPGATEAFGVSAWGLLGAVVVEKGDDSDAVHELSRAMHAPARVAYRGTRVIDSYDPDGDQDVTLRIEHSPRQGTSFEILSDASDPTATFVTSEELLGESRLAGEPLKALVDSYDISMLQPQRVANRPATVVAASTQGRMMAKFWIDDATGLLLRRELYDNGQVVRSTTFTHVSILHDGFMPHFPPELPVPSTTSLSMQVASPLNDDGWTSPDQLCNRFQLTGLNRVDSGDVLHAAYSDGLSTVSLFEQQGSLDPADLRGYDTVTTAGASVYVRYGLPTVAVWESDDIVFTLVTDAPRSAVAEVLRSLPHEEQQSPGTATRIGTGLQRIGSFVDIRH